MGRGDSSAGELPELGASRTSAEAKAPTRDYPWSNDLDRAFHALGRHPLLDPTQSVSTRRERVSSIRAACHAAEEAIRRGDISAEHSERVGKMRDYWLSQRGKQIESPSSEMVSAYKGDAAHLREILVPAMAKNGERSRRDSDRRSALAAERRAIDALVTEEQTEAGSLWAQVNAGDETIGVYSAEGTLDDPGFLALDIQGESYSLEAREMIALGEQLIRAGQRSLGLQGDTLPSSRAALFRR